MSAQLAVGAAGAELAELVGVDGARPACWSSEGSLVDLFFSDDANDIDRAKAICRTCPLMEPCLAGATARQEFSGVWGGQLFRFGHVLAVKRNRGRPRRDLSTIGVAAVAVPA